MKVPEGSYSLESFLAHLQDPASAIFEETDRKKWLKVQAVLHNHHSWQAELLDASEARQFGEVVEITLSHDDENSEFERFYAVEYQPGLLMFFTSADQDGVQKTLEKRLRDTRGFTAAWIPPALFQTAWQSILEEHGGFVYRFMSRRAPLDMTPARIRPQFARRFNYTGDDGTQVLKELQAEYGVTPASIYIQVDAELLIHITHRGFFESQSPSPLAVRILVNLFEGMANQLLDDKHTSENIVFQVVPPTGGAPARAAVKAGWVKLTGTPLSTQILNTFVRTAEKEFSFVDKFATVEPVAFSATVVDEMKGSVFDVSITDAGVTIVPKFHTTFESFLSLYRHVAEELDEGAQLTLFGANQG